MAAKVTEKRCCKLIREQRRGLHSLAMDQITLPTRYASPAAASTVSPAPDQWDSRSRFSAFCQDEPMLLSCCRNGMLHAYYILHVAYLMLCCPCVRRLRAALPCLCFCAASM